MRLGVLVAIAAMSTGLDRQTGQKRSRPVTP
jgi:hypothetical protein